MSLKDWARDVINRQRNIVFPDTNLNEGRFYRNIASGKAIFTTGQRLSLLGIVLFFVLVNAIDFARYFGAFVNGDKNDRAWSLRPSILSLIWLFFWIFLTIKAFFPPPARKRKRRRGYRSSTKRQV